MAGKEHEGVARVRDILSTPVPRADHPLRLALAGELHARPAHSLRGPQRGSHIAMLSGEGGFDADFAHLAEFCRLHGSAAPQPVRHFSADLGSFLFKWERHGEFCTYSFFRHGAFPHPFDGGALSFVPPDWLDALPGQRLVAVHIALDTSADDPRGPGHIARYFREDTLAGSRLSGGAATVWTDFQIHGDGFSRILLTGSTMEPTQAGRVVQRLLEIETYRMTALLALPLVQELTPTIRNIHSGTSDIAAQLAAIEGLEETRTMLARLSRLWAEIEGITARTSFRFDATRAYYDLVQRRTQRLREERIEGLQTIGEFLDLRLAPAMATCAATAHRIEVLAGRLARTSSLLSTQVDVALECQNRDLLANMDRRAGMQARLQRTLEVISICALTYYLSVLLGMALRGLNRAGLAIDVELVNGLCIPFMFLLTWLGLRWARRAVARADQNRPDQDARPRVSC
jgi:uncharacterized membrane-anchored protein